MKGNGDDGGKEKEKEKENGKPEKVVKIAAPGMDRVGSEQGADGGGMLSPESLEAQ